jgi:hypothetical protein
MGRVVARCKCRLLQKKLGVGRLASVRCKNTATPRRRLGPAWIARAGPATAPVFRFDYGSGHSLLAETAWLRAHGRLWRFVVQAGPFARIAPGRRLTGRDTAGLAALPPAPTPSSTPGLSPSLRYHTCAPSGPTRHRGDAQTPLGCRCSLSLHRSRIRSERSLSPVGCLIVAPAPAGGRRRERLCPSAPQGIARCAALHLAQRC